MKHDPPLLTQSRAEAFTASALDFVLWVFGIIVRLGLTGRSKKLGDVLRHAERAVELSLFLHAVALLGPLPRKKHRHCAAPPGARIVRSAGALFYKRAHIRARKANAIERIFALIDALQHPERAIAYFLKRIAKGLRSRRFVIAAPIAVAFFAAPAPFPQTTLDSS
ncbi:MAG: hypothetical protein IPG56_03745 [Caulobacteraceae bacterium]|nr:hypothetical protein [Caulobacteraceae bacterium]